MRQEWEEKLMNKITSSLVPGVSSVQMDKLKTKLMEEKEETTIYEQRYLGSLLSFNSFATDYNKYMCFNSARLSLPSSLFKSFACKLLLYKQTA